VVLIDLARASVVRHAPEAGPTPEIWFSADAGLLLIAGQKGRWAIRVPEGALLAESELGGLKIETPKPAVDGRALLKKLGVPVPFHARVRDVRPPHMVVSDIGKRTVLWDIERGAPVFETRGHLSWIEAARITPDYLVTAGMDGDIRIWSMRDGRLVRTLRP
jgi:hypothetical protein